MTIVFDPLIFIIWLLMMLGCMYYASKLNRSMFAYAVIALFFTPVVSWIVLLIVGNNGLKCSICHHVNDYGSLTCENCHVTVG